MSTRRKYTKEFKLDAISLVTEQGYTCPAAARSLGINSNILSRWIREAAGNNENAFRGNGKLTEEQLEIRQLREEASVSPVFEKPSGTSESPKGTKTGDKYACGASGRPASA